MTLSPADTATLGAAGAVAAAPVVTGDPLVGGVSLVTLLVWVVLALLRYGVAREQRIRAEVEASRAPGAQPSPGAREQPSPDARSQPSAEVPHA